MTDANKTLHRHPTLLVARAHALPLELGLVIMGMLTVILRSPSIAVWTLGAWLLAALTYMVLAAIHLIRASRSEERNHIDFPPDLQQIGVWSQAIHVDVAIIGFSSLMGVLGAVFVLRGADKTDFVSLARIIAGLSILCAWLLLQSGFNRLYADSYFRKGGLEFPGTDKPGFIEFVYFTFSIGATYQTSDTSVTTTHMRWLVTIHAIVCFVYNTVLLAFAVSLLMGR